jgi:hypothetical protein
MAEWSIEHAWKLIPFARADAHQVSPTHFRSTTSRNNDVHRHVPVSRRVCPGFRGECYTVLTQNDSGLPPTAIIAYGVTSKNKPSAITARAPAACRSRARPGTRRATCSAARPRSRSRRSSTSRYLPARAAPLRFVATENPVYVFPQGEPSLTAPGRPQSQTASHVEASSLSSVALSLRSHSLRRYGRPCT